MEKDLWLEYQKLIKLSFIHGLQPELTLPSDKVDGHIVCWFHKNKTKLIYQRWNEERLKNKE